MTGNPNCAVFILVSQKGTGFLHVHFLISTPIDTGSLSSDNTNNATAYFQRLPNQDSSAWMFKEDTGTFYNIIVFFIIYYCVIPDRVKSEVFNSFIFLILYLNNNDIIIMVVINLTTLSTEPL
jgi:hypothetical protein